MDYVAAYLAKLGDFEGNIPWLYRDSAPAGNCTVGKGTMLPTVQDSIKLQWYMGERPATSDEIRSDWFRVMRLPPAKVASYYRSDLGLTLPPSEIDMQASVKVGEVDAQLMMAFPEMPDYPDTAKLALMDMAYNLGIAGLISKFPHFVLAVKARNWQAAEAQCNRPQLSMSRNSWTKQLLALASQGV